MSKRNIILLVVAAFISFAVVAGLKARMRGSEQATAPVVASRILVAKQDIAVGGFVKTAQDLDWAPWPEENLQPYHIREGSENLMSFEGAVARRALKAGEPVSPNTLIKPGSGGFLSAVLEPHKRAVSIAVTASSAAAGLVFPGDFVDLIVTHRVKKTVSNGKELETRESVYSKTFIENVRVVAVDQQLDNPDNKALLAKTITVEVSAEQAERIAVASELGKISVALRSYATMAEAQDNEAAASGEGGPEIPLENGVEASHGAAEEDFSNGIGGSVSTQVRLLRNRDIENLEFYDENKPQ